MKYFWHYDFPIGRMVIVEADGHVACIFFEQENRRNKRVEQTLLDAEERETPLLKKAARQLKEYFGGKRSEFDLPLAFDGTVFQKSVWAALLTIPYGETRSYGDIAKQIGNPKGFRAVGMANNQNPIAIICPCHRVIGSNGSLVGYAAGLEHKEYLLNLESRRK